MKLSERLINHEHLMRGLADFYGIKVKKEGNDWAYDNENETIIIPLEWWIEDDTDQYWRENILKPHSFYAESFESVPQFVFNFYHEIGHHETDCTYDTTNLRKILDSLAQLNKRISLAGYFELPDEVDATDWALEQIQIELNSGRAWWN